MAAGFSGGSQAGPWPAGSGALWPHCHPERSKGSQATEKMRFFAVLRMTIVVKGEFLHYPLLATSINLFS